jgi:hypothetical protein
MTQKLDAAPWMAASFGAALVLALMVLTVLGADSHGTIAALRATGRLSYLLFWPAYAGGALAKLFGPRLAPLARRARSFGLAFAAAHSVHVGLVVWLYRISPRPPLSETMFWFFTIAIAWTYLLALLSVARFAGAVGRGRSRFLRSVGIEYIAFAFLVDFVITPLRFGVRQPLEYLPFALLAVAGPILRFAALVRHPQLDQRAASPDVLGPSKSAQLVRDSLQRRDQRADCR